ncbi:hypothetical protein [Clostridium tagluense]|uniref:Uncharacterized protein n=1 Tax=Clostridium tagluense TaxID=360422 RepID=A0A401UTK7_9CLOT|nr:hypothetical protein [Clostridium tagluense]GCD12892.1 hypothetical protein Ctaglu_45150 [Clostridium tagluense]
MIDNVNKSLKNFLDKAMEEKTDIYIVNYDDFGEADGVGYIQQLKVVYNREHDFASLFFNNENGLLEEAYLTSRWLNFNYIEMNRALQLN